MRVILFTGFLLFSLAVLYVVTKRMGLLKLQRKVMATLKAGMAGQVEIGPKAGGNGIKVAHVHENAVPKLDVPIEQPMHDEL
ncbi:unnamed protein product [Ilex paraguariensis]|uniref:Uncharacterized protein n=1 Tax=Ilex paraguariensis TaxID=185542 RepID=A0ABC8R4B4_9AQUA